jgi:hypothetical protein
MTSSGSAPIAKASSGSSSREGKAPFRLSRCGLAGLLLNRTPVEEIEGLLLELPATTSSRLIVPLKRPDDFLELARRGFFAYDWSDVHRTRSEKIGKYVQIAIPEIPLLLAELPSEITDLAEGIELNVTFLDEPLVDVAKDMQCREPT